MRKLTVLILLICLSQLDLTAYTNKPTWSVNPASYEYNMEVTARIRISDVTVASGGMLGAFVGSECRGVKDSGSIGPGGYVFILFLYSNLATGEIISFKFYDTASDKVYNITETINYVTDIQVGNAVNPQIFHCIIAGNSNKMLYLKVFVEGAFNAVSGVMNTTLNTNPQIIPLVQPYNVAPWNYAGTENVTMIPAGVVDWVLVELRDAVATADAILGVNLAGWPKAFFLKSDGSVVDLDGTSLPDIGSPTITNNLFVVIRHRNHLAVLSATGATLTGGVYSYDFTTDLSQAYGGAAGYKRVGSKAVMVTGDIDHDGSVYVSDYNGWVVGFGLTAGYFNADLDMDGTVYVLDFNKWAANFGSTTSIGNGGCTFTDNRDGHVYKCVKIGTQTWMAENLAYLPSVSPSLSGSDISPYYYVYGYERSSVSEAKATVNYSTYGVLYNWPAEMNGSSSGTSVPSGIQGICPFGWHLPSDAEWAILTDYLTNNGYGFGGSGSDIGKAMSATSGWTNSSTVGTVGNDQASNNSSGFTALPGGLRYYGGGFAYLGSAAHFWSSSEGGVGAWGRNLYFSSGIFDGGYTYRSYGFFVRCLKN